MRNKSCKTVFSAFLALAFAILSVTTYCGSTTTDNNQNSQKSNPNATGQKKNNELQQVKVYYFHTSFRCNTCTMIEELTKQAVLETFSKELNEKNLVFETVNIEMKENGHYTEKYKLITKSVIISRYINNEEKEWKNLDKIWTLIRDKEKYKNYIINEVRAYLTS